MPAKKPAPAPTAEPTDDDVAPDQAPAVEPAEPVDRGPGPDDAVSLVRRTKETP